MFTFIFERYSRPVHFIQATTRKEAMIKLNKILGHEYKTNWDEHGCNIRVIETKYVGIKVHVGDIEGLEI